MLHLSAACHQMQLTCLYRPLASPPSTSPLSFSHKSPPHRCPNEIIPLLFHLPLRPSPPRWCSGLTPQRQKICPGRFAMVISPSRPFSCSVALPHNMFPHTHTGSRSQIISSTLSVLRQLLLLLVTPANTHRWSLSEPSAVITSLLTVGLITLPVPPHLSTCCCKQTAEELSLQPL